MIEWTCAQRSERWSAHLDGRPLAIVRRAGIGWVVHWLAEGGDEMTAALSYPLRETAMAAVEIHAFRLIAGGALLDMPQVTDDADA